MEKVIEQMRIEKQLLAAENARLLALTEQLQQENLSLSEENADFKQRLGYPATTSTPAISIELPLSPASLPPLSPSPSDVTMSASSSVTSVTVAPPESSELTNDPPLQEQGPITTLLTTQSLAPGLSSTPDLTPWVQGCVITLSCVLVTLMTILRQSSPPHSSPLPPPPPPSLSTSHQSQSETKLPLKKRSWEVWSPPRS